MTATLANRQTQTSGTAVVAAGQTSVTITHGLGGLPGVVVVNPAGDTLIKRSWVTYDTTHIVVTIDSTANDDISYTWAAFKNLANAPVQPTTLTWKGAWGSGTTYHADDVVQSAGSAYVAVGTNTNAQPPNANWNLLAAAQPGIPGATGATGATGPQGPPGGMAWRGAWAGGTTYAAGDAVQSAGSAYFAIDASTGSTPPSAHWSLLASKGDTGSTGATGATGATGTRGATWTEGTSAPAGGAGANGDFYLRTSNGDVYTKSGGLWGVVGNITGPQGLTGPAGFMGVAKQPPNTKWATINREIADNTTGMTSGSLYMMAVELADATVTSTINIRLGSVGFSGGSHQWAGLFDSSKNLLAVSADLLASSRSSASTVTFTIAQTASGAAANYTNSGAGLYYVGLVCVATTTPTVVGHVIDNRQNAVAPNQSFIADTTGVDTPPVFPFTATGAALSTGLFWVWAT